MRSSGTLGIVALAGLAVSLMAMGPEGNTPASTKPPTGVQTKGERMAGKDANGGPAGGATTPAPSKPEEKPYTGVPLPEGSPLIFETTFHDFGKIPDTAPVTYDFKFKNTSDHVVKILKVQASCGCTTTKSKEQVEPGEESVITATFNPQGRSGREVKSITVDLDDPKVKNIFLTAVAYVQKRVMVEPAMLFMGEIARGKGAVQELSISGRDPGFEVTSAKLEHPNFTIESIGKDEVEVEGDKLQRFRYRVTLRPEAAMGTAQTQIAFTTNDLKQAAVNVSIMASVVGPIRVSPERLGVRFSGPGQPWVAETYLEPRDAGTFKVLSVQADDSSKPMNVVLDLMPGRPGTRQLYRLRVAGTTPAKMEDVQGAVHIKTDNAETPDIVLPFMAIQLAPATPAMNTPPGGEKGEQKLPGGTTVKPGGGGH